MRLHSLATTMDETLALQAGLVALGIGALGAVPQLHQRLQLSRAKHRSLAGHSRWAKRLARWMPGYAYDEATFLTSDGAPADVAARRRAALQRLQALYAARYPHSLALTAEAAEGIADLKFTGAYRVPYQYAPVLRKYLRVGAFVQGASGVTLTDLDGNTFYDLTGAYGVNVFGQDFYKRCMAEGSRRVEAVGAVLGAYHPVVADNVRRLKAISGLDEVSFHMSGTEAVMQAVRLARYHTRRKYLVRFCGAYHGWWEDVQPGPGNPLPPRETHTLNDMSEQALRVLERRKDIACVLVNPLQALHPNGNAPADSSLVDSERGAHYDRAAYTAWLQRLRDVCTRRGIVLIFDEVFMGFRLAPGGAQEYFGVQADLVTYGKTLGGGYPVGVVCGRHDLMQRFRPERPADLCFARGTFNAHPHVMGGMNVFLEQLETPRDPCALRPSGRGAGRTGARPERPPGSGRPAGSRAQLLQCVDDQLHRALALQLDAPVLPARRGAGAVVGGHGAPHLQPQLQRSRLRRGGRSIRAGGTSHEGGRVVVACAGSHEQGHPARDLQGDAGAGPLSRAGMAGRPGRLRATPDQGRCQGARHCRPGHPHHMACGLGSMSWPRSRCNGALW